MSVIVWKVLGGCLGRRYKLIFIVLLAILSVQLFLGYHSNQLDGPKEGNSGETGRSAYSHLSGGSLLSDDDEQSNNRHTHQHRKGEETAASKEVKSKRHLDNLSFTPQCDVQSKDAHSAINRARTDECKRQILETVCAIEAGAFYAKHLASRCPKGNYTRGRSLGCFQDDQGSRLLGAYYVNNKGTNSQKKCIEICLQSGFMYAGVQYGSECFCGNTPPPSTAQLADSSCTRRCPMEEEDEGQKSAASSVCGGYFTMNVLETGISSEYSFLVANLIRTRNTLRVVIISFAETF